MSISVIAAIGKNYELGKGNDLIWHFKADMKFFKETTMGAAVIMGRKTYESLPKLLPGRKNIIITRAEGMKVEGAHFVNGVGEALREAGQDEVFIIGGASVYSAYIPIADKLYLTEIDAECPDAEVYFPRFDKALFTRTVLAENEENGIKFTHVLYERI